MLLYVMCAVDVVPFVGSSIHLRFTNLLRTANRLCGRLPFEIEGTSRSQLHVDANLKLSSFRDFSLGKTQH